MSDNDASKDSGGGKTARDSRSASERAGSFKWIAAVLLAFVGYQIYSGVYIKEIGIPPFVIKIDTDRGNTPEPAPEPVNAELTRDFIVGRWQTSVQIGPAGGDSMTEYFDDGTFRTTASEFQGQQGIRQQFGGTWDFELLSQNRFRLRLWDEDGDPWEGIFEVLGPNRVQNTSQNYVSNRLSN